MGTSSKDQYFFSFIFFFVVVVDQYIFNVLFYLSLSGLPAKTSVTPEYSELFDLFSLRLPIFQSVAR